MIKNTKGKSLIALGIATAISMSSFTLQAETFSIERGMFPEAKFQAEFNGLSLESQKRTKAWLERIGAKPEDLEYLRMDKEGAVYYADHFLPDPTQAAQTLRSSFLEQMTVTENTDVFNLHSKPGSSNVIYLDFDGHLVSSTTAWTNTDLQAVAYDLDGDLNSFSQTEKESIASIWRRVAEDFAPFDVNITTQEPASFGPTVGRLLVTKDVDANGKAMPAQGAGGVAYVGVFGFSNYATSYSPAFVYYDNLGGGRADFVTEAASHEVGHNLGLSHDAITGSSYYGGHGTGNISWGPIMGTGYNRNVSQWSKGEYANATQFEDDISIITSKVNKRSDDHGDQAAQATTLVIDANNNVTSTTPTNDPSNSNSANKGIINDSSDVDVFSFTTLGGNISINANPALETTQTRGGNLDIQLSLHDSTGNLVASNNPAADTTASISETLAPGTYYLSVEGVSSANYTSYGSIGQYFLSGNIPSSGSEDTQAPTPNPMQWVSAPSADDGTSISMTAVTATDETETSSVEYNFACTSGGSGCVDSGWQSSPQYTATNLESDTSYSFAVTARDTAGNETVASASLSATTNASNGEPQTTNDTYDVTPRSTTVFDVLANDSDPDNDQLTIESLVNAKARRVKIVDNKISYRARKREGTETFSYVVNDGNGNTSTGTVTVNIALIGQPPVAVADTFTVSKGSTTVFDVLANDTDADGDQLTITKLKKAKKRRVKIEGNQISYRARNRVGTETFSYVISDGNGNSATTTVTVTVQ